MTMADVKQAISSGTKWGNKREFLMVALGAAIGLGNLWRFPYQCFDNGGGAFLIPFFIMTVLVAFPQVTADFAYAQYSSKGSLACWEGVPLMSGLGWSIMGMSYMCNTYYIVVVAYGVFYFFASFTTALPWGSCTNWWNTPACLDTTTILRQKDCFSKGGSWLNDTCETLVNQTTTTYALNNDTSENFGNFTSPADEYFHKYLLGLSSGIEDMGTVRWPIMLCVALCLVLAFVMLSMGTKSWGKISYLTTVLPYVVLGALLFQGVTREGSGQGILFLLTPRWEKLASLTVWADAAVQAYFSLGASGGFILTLGSHNRFHNNCVSDSIVVAVADTLTSLFCGIVIFSTIGIMAAEVGVPVDKVVGQGAGLAFVVYSDMIQRMPVAPLWSVLFNFTLLSLGIGSIAAAVDLMMVNARDTFPKFFSSRRRTLGVLIGFIFLWFIGSLLYATEGGMYLLQMMDANATFVLLFLGLTKGITMGWIYGTDRLCDNIHEMCGITIHRLFRYCYKFLTPGIVFVILVMRFVGIKPLKYGTFIYPTWCTIVSAGIAILLILIVPVVAVYKIIFTHTDIALKKRVRLLMTPMAGWDIRSDSSCDQGELHNVETIPLTRNTHTEDTTNGHPKALLDDC